MRFGPFGGRKSAAVHPHRQAFGAKFGAQSPLLAAPKRQTRCFKRGALKNKIRQGFHDKSPTTCLNEFLRNEDIHGGAGDSPQAFSITMVLMIRNKTEN